MSDLISRQELINDLNKFAPEHYNALVNDIILKQPSAERTGKWTEYIDERHGGLMGKCSECGKGTLNAISYDMDGNRYTMKFCPNCGADMGGEKHD